MQFNLLGSNQNKTSQDDNKSSETFHSGKHYRGQYREAPLKPRGIIELAANIKLPQEVIP